MDYHPEKLTKVIQYVFLSKRHIAGLTQRDLSLKSKITRQFISQVESGKRSPSIYTMSTLASVCDTTLTKIFQEIDGLYLEQELLDARFPKNINNIAASPSKAQSYIQDNKAFSKEKKPPSEDP